MIAQVKSLGQTFFLVCFMKLMYRMKKEEIILEEAYFPFECKYKITLLNFNLKFPGCLVQLVGSSQLASVEGLRGFTKPWCLSLKSIV